MSCSLFPKLAISEPASLLLEPPIELPETIGLYVTQETSAYCQSHVLPEPYLSKASVFLLAPGRAAL